MNCDRSKALVDALLKEYDKLSTTHDRHSTAGFVIAPLIMTAATAFLLKAATSPQPEGLIVAYGMVFLLAFLGVCHSVVCFVGLRLVQLELHINRELGVGSDKGLSQHSLEAGEGMKVIPGLGDHSIVIAIMMSVLFIASLVQAWSVTARTDWHPVTCAVVLGLPIVFALLCLLTMLRVEKSTSRRKRELVRESGQMATQLEPLLPPGRAKQPGR